MPFILIWAFEILQGLRISCLRKKKKCLKRWEKEKKEEVEEEKLSHSGLINKGWCHQLQNPDAMNLL